MLEALKRYFPGVFLSMTVAGAAGFLSDHYGAPIMLFAILIGMAFHYLMDSSPCKVGVEFCSKRILKIGVALMGVRVTLDQILSLGIKPIIIVIVCVFSTILFAYLIVMFSKNKNFHKSTLGILTGGSVAICGASAALAISLVLPKHENSERDTLFTVIIVTVLSTIAMIVYPILFTSLSLDEETSALLIGATIHDVAQVVGAGFSISNHAGEIATYVKLLRVAMLPIVIILLILLFKSKQSDSNSKAAKSTFPWFVVGFVLLLLTNSMGLIPSSIQALLTELSKWFLVIAIAALGVKTSLKKITDCGISQIMIVVFETIFILMIGVLLIKI